MEAITINAVSTRRSVWQRLNHYHIGAMPLPVYVVIAAITVIAALNKKLPNDMIGGVAVLMLAGMLLGEIGNRLPVLKHIGGAAILCLFVPSALIGYNVMNPEMLKAITTTMKTANLQYFYIACLVAGNILGMRHNALIHGFMSMFIPLLVGTLAAIAAG